MRTSAQLTAVAAGRRYGTERKTDHRSVTGVRAEEKVRVALLESSYLGRKPRFVVD